MDISVLSAGEHVIQREDGSRRVFLVFPKTGRVKPEFAKDADINRIMARYKKAKVMNQYVTLADVATLRRTAYGDFRDGQDFAEAARRLMHAKESFHQLPSAVRKRFRHDPAAYLNFLTPESLSDPKNFEEAVSLGLVNRRAKKPVVESPAPVPPTEKPAEKPAAPKA